MGAFLTLFTILRDLPEILLDHLAIVGSEFTRDLLQCGTPLFGGKIAPGGTILVLSVLNVARPLLADRPTIVERLAALSAACRLLLLLLQLLFNLLDDLAQLFNDVLFLFFKSVFGCA